MNVFDEMGAYWAEIANRNPTDRQVQFIKNTVKPNGSILDLACGTGRHLIPLAKGGYDIVGFDVSFRLLRIAKNRWREAAVISGDMRSLPFNPQAFSVVVSIDTSFGYLPSEEDDLLCLREVKRVLCTGGVFVIDVFNRENLKREYPSKRQSKWREYPSFFLLQKRAVTEDCGELRDGWVVRDKSDGQERVYHHVARLYELGQLQGLVKKAGFCVDGILGNYEGQSFSPDSERLILLAKSK